MNSVASSPRRRDLFAASLVLTLPALAAVSPALAATDPYATSPWRRLTDADWRRRLSVPAYEVLRHEGTERSGTSPLLGEHRKGVFACAGCGLPLFNSAWKFESGTGWPSFYTAIRGAAARKTDLSLGMDRIEYHCARCVGHQGHIFDDGPRPTGLRYCNNGVALKFIPA
ncbi:MAG: peptide-methionine (R)-S-oxide reductase MsrB [Caulobacteraceae bacterium]